MSKVLGVVLAGGDGTRMVPLTLQRAKPAVPIGSVHRLIDVPVSNLLHSGVTQAYIVVQRMPQSLIAHLEEFAHSGVARKRGQFIRVLTPPKMDDRFFSSDADSLVQLRVHLEATGAEVILIVMADQVAKIDYRQVVERLIESDAEAVMVYNRVSVEEARGKLGVLKISGGRVLGMEEKPANPQTIPGDPSSCFGNLAMYAIRKKAFAEMLDHIKGVGPEPENTLSRTGIQYLLSEVRVIGYDLAENVVPEMAERERQYFRDTGTPDAWFEVQMDLCHRDAPFNLFSFEWPIMTATPRLVAEAKFDRVTFSEAIVGFGAICEDGVSVNESVVGTSTLIGSGTTISRSVILPHAKVGRGSHLERVVVEKGIVIPDNTVLSSFSPPEGTISAETLYQEVKAGIIRKEVPPCITEGGILILPKGYIF